MPRVHSDTLIEFGHGSFDNRLRRRHEWMLVSPRHAYVLDTMNAVDPLTSRMARQCSVLSEDRSVSDYFWIIARREYS